MVRPSALFSAALLLLPATGSLFLAGTPSLPEKIAGILIAGGRGATIFLLSIVPLFALLGSAVNPSGG
jgi:hypothetical protein